ncbi:MAG: histidinol-phosphate transaminase [Leptospiraceae bacterium]|nr:histidinol-phosphate transaminase [Leptospiraceae bacterium]
MSLLNYRIHHLKPYTPGEQPDRNQNFIKLNTNENPYPPTPEIKKRVEEIINAGDLRKYPNPISKGLVEEIAKQNNLKENQILVTNGSDEGLALLFKGVLEKKSRVILPYPTYSLYPVLAYIQMNDSIPVKIPLRPNMHFDFPKLKKKQGKLLTFAYPNAPTGILENKEDIIDLVANFSGIVLCDEAYIDFAPRDSSMIDQITNFENLVVSRTFSKSYSLAGLRVGYLAGNTKIISELYKLKDSYNLGMLEQEIALAALKDIDYFQKNINKVIQSRIWLKSKLEKFSFIVYDSQTNFLYTKPPENLPAETLYNLLKKDKILVRYFSDEVCKDYIRISVGNEEENRELITKIGTYLSI